jgi:hypothetical protein
VSWLWLVTEWARTHASCRSERWSCIVDRNDYARLVGGVRLTGHSTILSCVEFVVGHEKQINSGKCVLRGILRRSNLDVVYD